MSQVTAKYLGTYFYSITMALKGTWASDSKRVLLSNHCFLNHLALCPTNPGMWDGQKVLLGEHVVFLGKSGESHVAGNRKSPSGPLSTASPKAPSPQPCISPLPPEGSQEVLYFFRSIFRASLAPSVRPMGSKYFQTACHF